MYVWVCILHNFFLSTLTQLFLKPYTIKRNLFILWNKTNRTRRGPKGVFQACSPARFTNCSNPAYPLQLITVIYKRNHSFTLCVISHSKKIINKKKTDNDVKLSNPQGAPLTKYVLIISYYFHVICCYRFLERCHLKLPLKVSLCRLQGPGNSSMCGIERYEDGVRLGIEHVLKQSIIP